MRFTLFAAAMAVAANAVRIQEPAPELPMVCEFPETILEGMTDAELKASVVADIDALLWEVHNMLSQGLSEEAQHELVQTETGGIELPKWLKSTDGKSNAQLDPQAESVKMTNGLMCSMIKKMKDAKSKGDATYNDVEKWAKEALDEHPTFKAAVEKAKRGGELAIKYGIPMWETVSAVKSVITAPMDPFAYKALYEKLEKDYELTKEALGPERVKKIGDTATAMTTHMKKMLGIPGGDTGNC